ncbi:MAG: hypothetical protein QM831_43840 [Kofleriaceae bacterium]
MAANLDELRFFLSGREELAPQIQESGATVTDVIAAISAEDSPSAMHLSPRGQQVSRLLEEAVVELSLDDLEPIDWTL